MKKLSLVSLAVAAVLAISPAAFAQSYDFNWGYTNNNATASSNGVFTATFAGGDTYDITSGTIVTYGDPTINGGATTSGTSFIPTPGNYTVQYSPSGAFIFDNVLTTPANPLIDNDGLLFYVAGREVNIFSNGPGPGTYQFYDQSGYNDFGNFSLSAPSLVSVPEYGAMSMLLLSIAGLAGGFFFKTRNSGLLLNA
jgi:hypothetical protein